jgi:mannose-6-phosphate isomerase-like protein (cupin superfamily)
VISEPILNVARFVEASLHQRLEPLLGSRPRDPHAADGVDRRKWLQTRPGERCFIRVAAADTDGAYSVVEIHSLPGDSTPMHVHQNEEEHIFVLEGTARVARGDETFDAPAGGQDWRCGAVALTSRAGLPCNSFRRRRNPFCPQLRTVAQQFGLRLQFISQRKEFLRCYLIRSIPSQLSEFRSLAR